MMERFRLRVRAQPKKGLIWELHLFPSRPGRPFREADGKVLGSSSVPEVIHWLRRLSEPALLRAEAPGPIAADELSPKSDPRWLRFEDGMRLALVFTSARWLVTPKQRQAFREGLEDLPSEVVLYWFTLCFYGYRQTAGRAALRELLTHEEPRVVQAMERPRSNYRTGEEPLALPDTIGIPSAHQVAEGLAAHVQRTMMPTGQIEPPRLSEASDDPVLNLKSEVVNPYEKSGKPEHRQTPKLPRKPEQPKKSVKSKKRMSQRKEEQLILGDAVPLRPELKSKARRK